MIWGAVLGRPWPADNRCPACGRDLGEPRDFTLDLFAASAVDREGLADG
jgi:hypothetical protein